MPRGLLGGVSHTFCLVESEKRGLNEGVPALSISVVDAVTGRIIRSPGVSIEIRPPRTKAEVRLGLPVLFRSSLHSESGQSHSRVFGNMDAIKEHESRTQRAEEAAAVRLAQASKPMVLKACSWTLFPDSIPVVSGWVCTAKAPGYGSGPGSVISAQVLEARSLELCVAKIETAAANAPAFEVS